jgi:sulfite reductase (ferredoxin)
VKAESQAFEAQIALDEGDFDEAEDLAYRAMLSAARALVRTEQIDVTEEPDNIIAEFKSRFFDTERFFDKYAQGKFGQYLLARHANKEPEITRDRAAARVEESLLFIEASHACEARIAAAGGSADLGKSGN